MELKGIKNIIFDLGGVLLNLDFKRTEKAFINIGIADFEDYFAKAKQLGIFDDFEIGKISESEFCVQLRAVSGINKTDAEIIVAWNSMLLDFPIVRKKLLLALKSKFSISLLSNTNETHIRSFIKTIQADLNEDSLAPLFHSVHYSSEIGFRKPNAAAFQYVLEHNNYLAEETLFLDDSIQHIEGARNCGIRAIHIIDTTVEELFADFLT
jgi:FMN phosphatase YigB (HAD superfamily)